MQEAAEEELTNAEVVELQKLQDREAAKSLFGGLSASWLT